MLWLTCLDDDTGTAKKANYNWQIHSYGGAVVASGHIRGHQRAKGWKKLLKKVTNAAMKVPTVVETQDEPELPFTPDHAI